MIRLSITQHNMLAVLNQRGSVTVDAYNHGRYARGLWDLVKLGLVKVTVGVTTTKNTFALTTKGQKTFEIFAAHGNVLHPKSRCTALSPV